VLSVFTVPAVAVAAPDLDTPQPGFRRHVINADSQFSSCAVMDVNRDGRPDIFCGGFWYEGPRWIRHRTREVPLIRGRYDDYSNQPLDVNGDGWTDIISVNYRSSSIYWVEHPGASLGEWKTHLIDSPGPSETGRLVDIDGDGRLDLLPSGADYAAWFERQEISQQEDGTTFRWIRHPLPDEAAGHGVGAGDINGDRRVDIVAVRGWFEAPTDSRAGRWQWRDEFRLHRDVSTPILVHDVDDDGDADLLWGRGHNIGLYWLEQLSVAGRRDWQLHAIDTSWACAHALLLADLDGDQRPELIAGKRYLGHDGRDPGEWDPLLVVAYRYLPARRSWQRLPISWGGHCGFDLDPAAADLDQDGDVDLVAPTRVGLCWLENLRVDSEPRQNTADESLPFARYSADEPLLVLRGLSDEARPVASRVDWGYRRWQILQNMQRVMGPLPGADRRVPLDVKIESREPAQGYERIRLSFAVEPGDRVPAYLLLPHGLQAPAAAMLCLHPTHSLGKALLCGLGGEPSRHYAHELAQRGFICLVPDYPSFGDYAFDFAAWADRYASGTMKAIWNNMRAIDLLESWPGVDRDHIGCIGHSLGGHNALFTAAFDQRLRAVVTSCGFTSFAAYYDGDLTGWTSPRYMPAINHEFGRDPDRMPFDFHEVLAAIAPRPIFINAPLDDDNFAVHGVRQAVERVSPVYRLFGSEMKLRAEYPAAGHDFPQAIREQVYAWLRAEL
jgi:dienelactone hydrolase